MKKHGNRIHQTPSGIWYFKFKFSGTKYCQTNFDTKEQAEQALQRQYKALNLTATGQPRYSASAIKEMGIERNITLTCSDKYKVSLPSIKLFKTFDTLEQARTFRDEHKSPRKRHVMTKARQPKQQKQPAIVSSFADKTERAKQAVMSKNALNKAIAEMNNATRTIVKATTPTVAELSRLAKQHINPCQFYIEQLKAGAYRV